MMKPPKLTFRSLKSIHYLRSYTRIQSEGPRYRKGPLRGGSNCRKIWPPTFLDRLAPSQPKTAIKSILASKSYGSSFYDMSYYTIYFNVGLRTLKVLVVFNQPQIQTLQYSEPVDATTSRSSGDYPLSLPFSSRFFLFPSLLSSLPAPLPSLPSISFSHPLFSRPCREAAALKSS